jgi:hypothetical protein
VDASAWEAADALREQMVAGLSEKQQAVKWAQDSMARYAAAAGSDAANAKAEAAELTRALDALAKSGLLKGASAELLKGLKDAKMSGNAAALRALLQAAGEQLGQTSGQFGDLAALGQEAGRFNPAEFPLDGPGSGTDGDGLPGRGGVNRGRADAELTWGQETSRVDKFKSQALPPGAPRSPDDWAPVVVLPGAPQESPVAGVQSAGRQYADTAGQAAWRRTLAPRHLAAVKKYFGKGQDK